MNKYNCNKCKPACGGIEPFYNAETYSNLNCNKPACNTPVRRHLQPTLVAQIYNQFIIEEIPHSSMGLTLDETATISSAYSEAKPLCGGECGGYIAGRSDVEVCNDTCKDESEYKY